jgi:hypothetical protein
MPKWPPPVFRIEIEFDAPRDFAFAWCTDLRPDDATRSKEHYERRILKRSRDTVLCEDLYWQKEGWGWRRNLLTRHPPDHWHVDSLGTYRTASLDYRLEELPGGRSRFSLTMRRRPSEAHPRQPTRAELEGELTRMWTNYGRVLARDYRAHRGDRGSSRKR